MTFNNNEPVKLVAMNYAYEEKERLTYVMLEIFLRKAAFSVGFSNF